MPKKKSSGCSKLLKAVQQNRFEDVAKILARGTSDINTRNKEGLTALSVCRNSQIAKLLISKGANVEIKDFDGYTPLARCLDLDLARILIESGADVNAKFGDGRTVLNEIAAGALCHIMVLLLSKGATTWGDCAIGTKFFSRLFQNFVLLPDPTFSLESRKVIECIYSQLYKSKQPSRIIQHLLESDAGKIFLKCALAAPAPVHCTKTEIGTNIVWSIGNGLRGAHDSRTGQDLDLHQVLFDKITEVTLPFVLDGEETELKIPVCGTVEQVFEQVDLAYKPWLHRMDTDVRFQCLEKERDGSYYLFTES